MEVQEYSWEDATNPNRHGLQGQEKDDQTGLMNFLPYA